MHALIVENSRLYRQLLDTVLGQQGFKNDVTDEIGRAKSYLQDTQYDIIILNENLKDGSGIEFAQYCKSHEQAMTTPVLLFSSDDDIEHKLGNLQVEGIVYKHNLQQISDQLINFLETRIDPLFYQGKILLIEDSESISQLILAALNEAGYRVNFYKSAEAAWNEFKQEVSYGSDHEAFDLVISDINLEGDINGLQLIQKIRKLDDARGFIPIIAITAQPDTELRLSLYRAGINDFIAKPILLDEMLIRVKNLITNKRLLDKVHDQRRELFALATTDKLTGCQNRHSLMDFSSKFISQAQRHCYPVSVIMLDLDHFKKINDAHGHSTGDGVLQATGELLNRSFREGDMVARFGGEEFVVLLNHCTGTQAMHMAETLRKKLHALKPMDLAVSASIGVTSLENTCKLNFETLFNAADQAVYEAKLNGRNQVCFRSVK